MTVSTSPPNTGLDCEELFGIAVLDSRAARHEQAIEKLNRILVQQPDNARAYCMLGAEHAEIGLFDRALVELERATTLDPSLAVAHFQLGLLRYLQRDFEGAKASWAQLHGHTDADGFAPFARALLLLAEERLTDAAHELDAALAAQPSNSALAGDMRNIRDRLEQQLLAAKSEEVRTESGDPVAAHALLSSYQDPVSGGTGTNRRVPEDSAAP